ncbi:MAG: glutamate 5-kinase [Saprospiraceae bacterium]|nr:glutamate 5-kinase [Saprospiraceae bacterium]
MIVIKVGTNVLSDDLGMIDQTMIASLVLQVVNLKRRGVDVILISSGAVGAGRQVLNSTSKSLGRVERRQLLAAVGQPKLLQTYMTLFEKSGIHVAQILATKEDFRDRKHYLHMRNCFLALLNENVIPIVNENDTIAVDELMFTDNDELASLVASMMGASALYILTNVEGVYLGDPADPDAKVLSKIDPGSTIQHVFSQVSSFGRGGMATKYRMSKQLASTGIDVYIANGKRPGIIDSIYAGEHVGTHFVAQQNISSVKKWIAYQDRATTGAVVINEGAKSVLLNGNKVASLLPVGVSSIVAPFEKGDLINILGENEALVGIGKAQYASETLEKYLGQKQQKALIHYDYLVILYERNDDSKRS